MAHGDETRGHNWRWGAVQIWKRHSTLGWTCSFWILHKGVIWPHHPPLFLVWGPTNFTSPMPSPAVFIRKPPKHFLHYMPHPFSLSKLVTVGDVNPWPWVSNVFFLSLYFEVINWLRPLSHHPSLSFTCTGMQMDWIIVSQAFFPISSQRKFKFHQIINLFNPHEFAIFLTFVW